MTLTLKPSREHQLSTRLNLMVSLVVGLLLANVLLSALVWVVFRGHRVEIIPFGGTVAYANSPHQVDARYLSLMAENFMNERLNVTPETVDGSHQRLLGFVASQHYPAFLLKLQQEASVIKAQKLSSVFHISRIQTDPHALTAVVTGVLKRFVGLNALTDETKTFLLRFQYRHNRLTLTQFDRLKEESHV